MAEAFPAVFVSHGPPSLILDGGPACDFLAGLGTALGRPRAVLAVSAHWETQHPAVSAASLPTTIHDFYGFPRALYAMRYAAPGAPALAARAAKLLGEAGFEADIDPGRGLDHGAWVPLKLMYPAADVPVFQLAVQPGRDAAHHLALGRALVALRAEGVLVLGTGGAVHNLGALRRDGAGPDPWAAQFADWLDRAVADGAADELAHYRTRAPHAALAHPTDEHLLPLFVAAGAGAGKGRRLHAGFASANLAMHAYAWGMAEDSSKRRIGVHDGQVKLSDNFNDPLPKGFDGTS